MFCNENKFMFKYKFTSYLMYMFSSLSCLISLSRSGNLSSCDFIHFVTITSSSSLASLSSNSCNCRGFKFNRQYLFLLNLFVKPFFLMTQVKIFFNTQTSIHVRMGFNANKLISIWVVL